MGKRKKCMNGKSWQSFTWVYQSLNQSMKIYGSFCSSHINLTGTCVNNNII